ncbi:hypothetical protein AB7B71_07250 [Acinetobacter nosocomialis]
MQQLMIMVTEVGKLEHSCNLLAEVNKGGKVMKGLVRRREAERALFLKK